MRSAKTRNEELDALRAAGLSTLRRDNFSPTPDAVKSLPYADDASLAADDEVAAFSEVEAAETYTPSQIATLMEMSRRMSTTLKQVTNDRDGLEGKVAELTTEAAELEEVRTALQSERDALKEGALKLEDDVLRLSEDVRHREALRSEEKLKSEADETKIEELMNALDEREKELTAARQATKAMDALETDRRVKTLQSDLDRLHNAVGYEEARAERFSRELHQAKADAANSVKEAEAKLRTALEEHKTTTERATEEHCAEVLRLTSEHAETIERLRETEAAVQEHLRVHALLVEAHAALQEGRDTLEEAHYELSKGHEELTEQHAALTEGHTALADQHTETLEQLRETEEAVQEHLRVHALLVEAHAALQAGHDALDEAHRELTKGHEELTDRHAALTDSHAELTEGHAALTEDHAALEISEQQQAEDLVVTGLEAAMATDLRREVDELTAARDAAHAQLESLKATHQTSLSLAAELGSSNMDSTAEYDDLQDEVNHLSATCERLQSDVESAGKEKRTLETKLNEATSKEKAACVKSEQQQQLADEAKRLADEASTAIARLTESNERMSQEAAEVAERRDASEKVLIERVEGLEASLESSEGDKRTIMTKFEQLTNNVLKLKESLVALKSAKDEAVEAAEAKRNR